MRKSSNSKKKKKEVTRDKYWSDFNNFNIDYAEISLPNDEMETYIEDNGGAIINEEDYDARTRRYRRKERLLRKVFKAASECLTDVQLRIFMMRATLGLKEVIIARRLKVDQGYVSVVLRNSYKKIREKLRLSDPSTTEDSEDTKND